MPGCFTRFSGCFLTSCCGGFCTGSTDCSFTIFNISDASTTGAVLCDELSTWISVFLGLSLGANMLIWGNAINVTAQPMTTVVIIVLINDELLLSIYEDNKLQIS